VRRDTMRRRFSTEEGLTLVEIMVAIFVLGVILSALAGVIMTSLRTIGVSEREVRATALAQQSVEEFQSIAWDAAGLYEDEVSTAPTEWNGGNSDSYNGDELVVLPAPLDPTSRLAQVPLPYEVVPVGNTTYTVSRFVSWIDSDGDGTPETKRFTAVVNWSTLTGDRTITAVGDRVPTQAEAPATSLGTRVLAITAAPDPAQLDNPTAENLQDIVVTVRANRGIPPSPLTPTLRFYTLGEPPASGEAEDESYVERTLTMDGSLPGENGFPTRWRVTVPAGTYRFVNGSLDVLFTGKDSEDGNLIETFGSLQLRGGPRDGPAPRPARVSDEAVFPTPPTDSQDPDDPITAEPVRIQTIPAVNSPICVDKSTWKLTKPIEITVNTKGLVESDGTVTVAYVTWTERQPHATKLVADTATFSTGGFSSATYRHTISDRMFRPGQNVIFSVKGIRADGSNHTMESSGVPVSDSC
jgi:type II secretory pathway pseudopilin PulG